VNTFRNEYAPVPYEKNKFIISSDRQASTGDEKYGWTGEKFTDFYTVSFKDPKYDRAKKFTENVNTVSHEGTCTFNKNFTEMIFARTLTNSAQEDNFTQLFITHRQLGGEWETPVLLHVIGDDSMQNVGQPFLTEDSKNLYFSSDAAGGYGGKDIYVCTRTNTGWGAARNIGATVNSEKDEMFPFLRKDNILFFSSNGFEGMGGLDIFTSQKNGWKFSRPQNLQSPINSGGDDFGIYFFQFKSPDLPDTIIGKGYFTSTRFGGKGGDDIYRFELRQEVSYRMEGIVSEAESNEILPNAIVQLYEIENNIPFIAATDTTDRNGKFSFTIQNNKDFKVTATARDHFAKSEFTTSKNLPPANEAIVTINRDVSLVKFVKNKQITVPNIFYDLDKADVRPDAAAILDSLVLPVMLENPDLKFELGSHTDAQGSDEHNQALSQARADKVVEYLINKGIAADRLIAKGYGETQIINRCLEGVKCSDEEHQQNRRTTFKIIDN
jgi:outer membrane protein OmpA-like peptidoglycan-associated protein